MKICCWYTLIVLELIKAIEYSYKVDIWILWILCHKLAECDQQYIDFSPVKTLFEIVDQVIPEISNKELSRPIFFFFLDLCLRRDTTIRLNDYQLINY
jgi:hypothetical protein